MTEVWAHPYKIAPPRSSRFGSSVVLLSFSLLLNLRNNALEGRFNALRGDCILYRNTRIEIEKINCIFTKMTWILAGFPTVEQDMKINVNLLHELLTSIVCALASGKGWSRSIKLNRVVRKLSLSGGEFS